MPDKSTICLVNREELGFASLKAVPVDLLQSSCADGVPRLSIDEYRMCAK
jgi:hypothetical protein